MRVVITCFFIFVSLGCLKSQVPFTCDGQLFLTLEPSPGRQILVTIVIDPITGLAVFQTVNRDLGIIINGIGYRRTDNLLYGVQPVALTNTSNAFNLYQIDATSFVRNLATLRLSAGYGYFGGDVTPDGRFLIIVGVPNPPTFGRTELVLIDLEDPLFSTTRIPMSDDFRIFDLAFDPTTGDLYGFDSRSRRLLLIDPTNAGILKQFRVVDNISQVIGMFFDAFGNLLAYAGETEDGNDILFRVDKSSGVFTRFVSGEAAQNGDAASCPFTIDIIKMVEPIETVPCSEVLYTFDIVNGTSAIQNGISFADQLPLGFSFVEIVQNDFGGQLVTIPGSNKFRIDNMTLPIGVRRLVLRVEIGPVTPREYNNQAVLFNLPAEFGLSIVSDNPVTPIVDDSTSLLVLGVPEDSLLFAPQLCEGESTQLDGRRYGNMNTWSTGETSISIDVATAGIYTLQAIFGCDTTYVEYDVSSSTIAVELTNEIIEIHLGDTISLSPTFFINTGNVTTVGWTDPLTTGESVNSIIICHTCLSTFAIPFNDTEFTIQVINEFGCSDDASLEVLVDKTRRVFGPEVFTPNDDGINDFFFLQSPDQGRILRFIIYNRWGDEVFSRRNFDIQDVSQSWDGRYKGELLNPAVFIWVAEIEFLDAIGFEFGDITLLR